VIEIKNLTKFYYSSESVALALDDISLTFAVGDFVAITGESGSGKSTLLKVMNGTETYEEGEMCFDGVKTSAFGDEDWDRLRREEIAVVYQDYQILDNYSVLENVESVLLICEERLGKLTPKERRAKAMSYLEIVGLTKQAKQKASHISSGQKQRLAIARALAKNSQIIIADEPTGNLDVENGRMVMQFLAEIAKTRLVIVVTHNYEQAEDFVTRLIRLYRGQVSDDIRLRESAQLPATGAEAENHETPEKRMRKRDAAGVFLKMNLRRQPIRNGFFFLLCLCLSLAFLVFLGIIAQNLDDAQAMEYNEKAYFNGDDTRILIRNVDGSELTADDFAAISQVKYVER